MRPDVKAVFLNLKMSTETMAYYGRNKSDMQKFSVWSLMKQVQARDRVSEYSKSEVK